MALGNARTALMLVAAMALVPFCSCRQNRAPEVPDVPSGPTFCFKDTTYTFTTTASDPDGDSVAVRFDWGDSTPTYWMGWYASGETVAMAHAWQDTGTYEVHAWAQDRKLVTSDSSAGLAVRVGLRRPPYEPIKPAGPTLGDRGWPYAFTTRAFHPDRLKVSVRFMWGDGDTSDWSPFLLSGSAVEKSHAWSAPGTYAVAAQARDTGDALSDWSASHVIYILPGVSWRWRLPGAAGESVSPKSCPAVGPDGTIYVGARDSSLFAVYPDGTLKWRFLTGGSVHSSPAIGPDGTIYIGSYDNYLYAVYPDGTLRWKCLTNSRESSPAVAADGTVYIGSSYGHLHAVNADGTLKWSFPTNSRVTSSPAIAADGTIYVGSEDCYLYAVYPDGTFRWRYGAGGSVHSSPAIDADGTVCFGSSDYQTANVHALYPDGSLKWSYRTGGAVVSSPAIAADGTVYVGSSDRGLYALSPDGSLKYRIGTGGSVYSSPAIAADGTVYFGSTDHYLYALYPDGSLKWRCWTGGELEAPLSIDTDGAVYFTGGFGFLYALNGASRLADSPWPKFHRGLENTGRGGGSAYELRMVGRPILTADFTGFIINIVNAGTTDVTTSWLRCSDSNPDDAWMRTFMIDGNLGLGYPIPGDLPATGPGDTVWFAAPVTIPPDMSETVELMFLGHYTTEYGYGQKANVHGKVFRFRFDDGSELLVHP